MITPATVQPKTEIFSADQADLVEHLRLAKGYLEVANQIAEGYRQTHSQLATDCADAVHHCTEALSQVES